MIDYLYKCSKCFTYSHEPFCPECGCKTDIIGSIKVKKYRISKIFNFLFIMLMPYVLLSHEVEKRNICNYFEDKIKGFVYVVNQYRYIQQDMERKHNKIYEILLEDKKK